MTTLPHIATPRTRLTVLTPEAEEPDSDPRWHSNDLLLGCGDEWAELIAHSGLKGRLRQLALHSTREILDDSRWSLRVVPEFRHLISQKAMELLAEGVSAAMGRAISIGIDEGAISAATPWQIEQQRYAELLRQAQESLDNEPDVQFFRERFGAEVDTASILPLKH